MRYIKAVTLLIGSCLLTARIVVAQTNAGSSKMYKVHYAWEVPVSAVFLATCPMGFKRLDEVARYNENDVNALDPASINAFDRPVAFYDPSQFKRSGEISDLVLNLTVASPVLLLLDKKVRNEWKDFLSLFLVTHTVDNALYFSAAFTFRRARPLTYNPELSMVDKTGVGKSNSFFSGHVSWSAASTFFMAKLYTDYHHVKGWKRMAIYTGAAIPPGLVGYYRMRAGKHFKTDVITGLVLGAACGIGIPELHRNKSKDSRLSVRPFSMLGSSGLTLTYVVE